MSAALKKTTRLTGLAVAQNPHRDLNSFYSRILKILNTFPKDYPYRQHTETLITDRLNIVKQNESVADIEAKINCGQVEELIVQAKKELSLVEDMQYWKPWESLVEQAPPRQWTWPPHK